MRGASVLSLASLSAGLLACSGEGAVVPSAPRSSTTTPPAVTVPPAGSTLGVGAVVTPPARPESNRPTMLGFEAEDDATYLAIVSSGAEGRGEHRYGLSFGDGVAAAEVVRGCARSEVDPKPAPVLAIDADRPPALGETRTFRFRGGERPTEVTAEAVAVGRHAVVWADTGRDHPADIDRTFADAFLRDFERLILPRARLIFGVESDVDGDGRIALLFTPLTRTKAVAFFSGCDLHPDCPASNRGEVLYLTPPNAIRPPYNTPRAIKEILSHELEHLLHHHHKVLAHGVDDDPDGLYLHEGFGALAQDVTGFQAGNLYVTKAGLSQIDATSLNPFLTERTGYDQTHDGPLRGIAYLFTRWLYDRAGGDVVDEMGKIADRGGPTLLRSLLASQGSIAAELVGEGDRSRLIADFYTALAAPEDGAINPCFGFRPTVTDPLTGKQRGADPYARFHGQQMGGAATQPFPGDGTVRAGGADLVIVPSSVGPTTVTLDASADARLELRVMRIE